MNIIHPSYVLSPLFVFAQCLGKESIVVEKQEHYQKRSYRNRYEILTANGVQALSIPLVKGKNNQMLITDVLIAYDEPWCETHLRSIRSAYAKSPFFDFYFEELASIFRHKHTHLFSLNGEILAWALNKLKLTIDVQTSSSYQKEYPETLDIRFSYNQNQVKTVTYVQVWQEKFGFVPHLSILDLLFCEGPNSKQILHKMVVE